MIMKNYCPIFQWSRGQNFPIFEQISTNISGVFGAFTLMIPFLQRAGLLSETDKLENINFGKTRIFYRDNMLFQSIYFVNPFVFRNQKIIVQLMQKIDNEFMQNFGDSLKNWDHSIDLFIKFNEICEKLL